MIDISSIDFAKSDGLIPVVAQDVDTRQVLMLGYADIEAITVSQQEGRLTFFSRTKNRLWTKGEESGNFLQLISLHLDCDHDTILALVKPQGPTCHKGTDTCWGMDNVDPSFLPYLEQVISDRRSKVEVSNSYIASLFDKGINKIAQKVGEEAVELVIEAKDNNPDLFLGEAADLMLHYLVLLQAKGYTLKDVEQVLKTRHKK
jgi:phosphoribosyl-AMP cyclohydrolase / phosphoribosyl-ATP pyrophosphohydrolase